MLRRARHRDTYNLKAENALLDLEARATAPLRVSFGCDRVSFEFTTECEQTPAAATNSKKTTMAVEPGASNALSVVANANKRSWFGNAKLPSLRLEKPSTPGQIITVPLGGNAAL